MNAAKLDPALCRRLAALANGPSLAVLPLTTPERADIAAQLIAAAALADGTVGLRDEWSKHADREWLGQSFVDDLDGLIAAARAAKELAGAVAPSATDTITISIPLDLVETVARALESLATHYLNDTGHSPEGIAVLQRDADRLDEIAESIRQLAGEAE